MSTEISMDTKHKINVPREKSETINFVPRRTYKILYTNWKFPPSYLLQISLIRFCYLYTFLAVIWLEKRFRADNPGNHERNQALLGTPGCYELSNISTILKVLFLSQRYPEISIKPLSRQQCGLESILLINDTSILITHYKRNTGFKWNF